MIMKLIQYWSESQEYETQSSPEARLVKEFDLLEMILQAYEYEDLEGTPGRLQEFFDSTNGIALSRSIYNFCSLALTSCVGFQVVSSTPTCSSSLDLWVNRGDATCQKQRCPRTLKPGGRATIFVILWPYHKCSSIYKHTYYCPKRITLKTPHFNILQQRLWLNKKQQHSV